jgi:hypothetical protein
MENMHDNVVVNDGEEVFMGQGGLASAADGEPVALDSCPIWVHAKEVP